MLLYDLTHTSHSRARTGVQRVVLELRRALREHIETCDITHDPHARIWRPLQGWEHDLLDSPPVTAKRRGASWPWWPQVVGTSRRLIGRPSTACSLPKQHTGFFTAEIFTAHTGAHLTDLFANVPGPKVALFHDAIALRRPDVTPPGTVGRFPHYLNELRRFDGVLANSADSRQSLLDYWAWAGWSNQPPVEVLPLGVDHLPAAQQRPAPAEFAADAVPEILCVGSLEGRKNHRTLLEACERLWAAGERFELRLIGGLQRETGVAAYSRLRELQAAGRPLHYEGWLDDDALDAAYRRCAFNVYPSLLEGFGLPVWESLLHGKPCICSRDGAPAEIAAGGGCLPTDTRSPEPLAEAIRQLLHNPDQRHALARAAADRSPPRWSDAARKLTAWMTELSANQSTTFPFSPGNSPP